MSETTLGVMIGNRGFFPDALAREGREEVLRTLEAAGYKTVCLTPEETKHGAVETLQEARKCADLFKQHREEIDGIVVSLPNFGDERGVANALRMSGLEVPVLVQAFPDEPNKMLMGGRRDSFCGKMSVCNNLWQYGIRYTLTRLHTESPGSEEFKADLDSFAATCRIVKGLKNLRVGVIGARPAAFNTVRFSEKLLEHAGITVEPLDLSEVLGRIQRLADDDAKVKEKLASIGGYVETRGHSAGVAAEDGEVRGGGGRLDGGQRIGGNLHPVLDGDGGVFRRGALHADEHDVEQPAAQRLRDGHDGHGGHVRAATGFRDAERHCGLEQQLRRRSGQVRHLPLLEPAQTLF